jgi:hypothetical protein
MVLGRYALALSKQVLKGAPAIEGQRLEFIIGKQGKGVKPAPTIWSVKITISSTA